MKLLRSWPKEIPDDRAYVEDDAERFVMEDFSYNGLGDIDDDILLIEWDIAVGKEDLAYFAMEAARNPKSVLVAPYKLYFRGTKRTLWADHMDRAGGCWAHLKDRGDMRLLPVEEGDPTCHYFGFGLAYLPRDLIREYLDRAQRYTQLQHFTDSSFSLWHTNMEKQEAPICWDVRPVHLHYPVDDLLPKRELNIPTWTVEP